MKNKIYWSIVCAVVMLSFLSCDKEDELVVDYNMGGDQYTLPRGEPGSVDEKIYQIHEKYGIYLLYDFTAEDMRFLWNNTWTKWYVPANLSNNKIYVSLFVDKIEELILKKYEVDFIKRTFPYKVFLVDTLRSSSGATSGIINMQSNGQNAIAISNVGKKSDKYVESDWKKFAIELETIYSVFYYSSLPVKPVEFIVSRAPKINSNITDPSGEDIKYDYCCWTVGYVMGGSNGTSYSLPKEDADYANFVSFLTGTAGSEIKRRFIKYPALKERALVLVPYLYNVVNINVVSTQNNNFPSDKLPVDFFDKLQ